MTDIVSDGPIAHPSAAELEVVALETITTELQPNVVVVALHDRDGNVGLGETFYGASSVEAHLHDVAVPLLRDIGGPYSPARVARLLAGYVGYSGSGSEMRANSAIDIALWDLAAKRAGLALRDMLGGPVRRSIPVYNTCAGARYVNAESRQSSSNWGIGDGAGDERFEDLRAFLTQPGRLARELVDAGFPGMKVWPFDLAAEASEGSHRADLRFGLSVLDEIRESVGDELELYVELHSLWNPWGAERLLRELERFEPAWAEDPIRADHAAALATVRSRVNVPIAVGENIGGGVDPFRRLLDARAIDVAIVDLGWSGGVTAALKTAALAESLGVPIAPHDCTGPISLAVATHLVTAVPNGYVQEVARAFYHGWYREIADGLPVLAAGEIAPGGGAGHGITLRPEFLAAPGTRRRRSSIAGRDD